MSRLSKYFKGVIVKRLSSVEVDKTRSNQHEFNGIKSMVRLFGKEKIRVKTDFIYLGEEEDETLVHSGFLTWYDARSSHISRTEYRLYFESNEVMSLSANGDLLIIAKKEDDSALLLIVREGSSYERLLLWLFGLTIEGNKFSSGKLEGDKDKEVGYVEAMILETLGIQPLTRDDWLDKIIERFGVSFPSTYLFSAFARETAEDVDFLKAPDKALTTWINQEEMLFRTLERHKVQKQLDMGFENVDVFIKFSLSVQNRRKSRMGYAFENHLNYLFTSSNLSFSKQKITEQNSKPDYLFPGINEYHDASFPTESLTMLGVKSSCKERWNQVLSEANRIDRKHLLTLEPSISLKQTKKMQEKLLQLILPESLHETYLPEQRGWLMNLQEFIALVKGRELT